MASKLTVYMHRQAKQNSVLAMSYYIKMFLPSLQQTRTTPGMHFETSLLLASDLTSTANSCMGTVVQNSHVHATYWEVSYGPGLMGLSARNVHIDTIRRMTYQEPGGLRARACGHS